MLLIQVIIRMTDGCLLGNYYDNVDIFTKRLREYILENMVKLHDLHLF